MIIVTFLFMKSLFSPFSEMFSSVYKHESTNTRICIVLFQIFFFLRINKYGLTYL